MSDRDRQVSRTTRISDEELARFRALKAERSSQRRFSLLIYHRDGVRVVPLVEGQSLVVGRCSPADVPIRDSSLSRQHACVELLSGEVWVEDLGSTNGTRLDGDKIQRSRVEPEAELTFGVVTATIHTLTPGDARQAGPEGHDRFSVELEREVSRSRLLNHPMALLLVRNSKRGGAHLVRWLPSVQTLLRPFDRLALYSADTVEVLLPEADQQQARELADAIMIGSGQPLRCGLGLLPGHAGSAGELLEVTRRALQGASDASPIQLPAGASVTSHNAPPAAVDGPVVRCVDMEQIYSTAAKLASSGIPVLIQGQTGTGKEVVARAIHDGGKRRGKALVCVNCGAIPGQLVESTLFGHEKGAFTGAAQQTKGVFEAAAGGTVLLDEIGELPRSTQVALLRVLESKRITRVGSNREIEVDVRILAATHRDLEAMCKAGEFREDLLYRLNAMTLRIPPLRDRLEEIQALACHFIDQANQANERHIKGLDEGALELLLGYAWPGNVRELRNTIERAVVIASGETITVEDLPEKVRELAAPEADAADAGAPPKGSEVNLQADVQRFEGELILKTLRETGWNRKEAARRLDLPVRSLARKMQALGIKRVGYERGKD